MTLIRSSTLLHSRELDTAQYRWSARLSGSNTLSLTSSSWTKITGTVFNSEDEDSHSAFAGGTYTVPEGGDGLYFICGVVEVVSLGDGDTCIGGIFVGGGANPVLMGSRVAQGASAYACALAFGHAPLEAGDTVDFRVWHDFGSARTTRGTSDRCHFSGFLVG